MKRGDKELECLNYIRSNTHLIRFQEMSQPEQHSFLKFLNSVQPNPHASEFPDFVHEYGFIEHFEINASKENRKGSFHRIEENKFNKHCAEVFSNPPQRDGSGPIELHVMKEEMDAPVYTREDFLKSFKTHFEDHMDSLRKYESRTGYRVFLAENKGATFGIRQDRSLLYELYRPSLDAELLDYLFRYTNDLTHIIFRSAQIIEVLPLESIPTIRKAIPSGITFKVGNYKNTRINLVLDLSL